MDKIDRYFLNLLYSCIAVFGVFSASVILLAYNSADYDIWARLVQGASLVQRHTFITTDLFAFTPVLPHYTDHEWGMGLVSFFLLDRFSPSALLYFKTIMGILLFVSMVGTARLLRISRASLFFLFIPVFIAIIPAFQPVVRSHVFTYLFFSLTLWVCEKIRRGSVWVSYLLVVIMCLWMNVHGGVASGFGMLVIYTGFSFFENRKQCVQFIVTGLFSIVITLINPYGVGLWTELAKALTLDRVYIAEWQPLVFFQKGIFIGFRILFVVMTLLIMVSWRFVTRKREALPGLMILAVTAFLTFRHVRHATFFAIACGTYGGLYLDAFGKAVLSRVPRIFRKPHIVVLIMYATTVGFVSQVHLPQVTGKVTTPERAFPARAVDILYYSKSQGNMVVPLGWGNYIMWRLAPRIKISMCGRYEAMYPLSTLEMNYSFLQKKGENWKRLVKDYPVDFVLYDPANAQLTHDDLVSLGFRRIYANQYSALYAREALAYNLEEVAYYLPEQSFEPLDPEIPRKWWDEEGIEN